MNAAVASLEGKSLIRGALYRLDVARPRLIERRMTRFLHEPVSVRNAANVIVVATAVVVVASGVAMRVLDHEEYPTIWRGMWWALQTVTTVGYGDVTPLHRSGRIVAAFVMLEGIAFVAIVVAAITSTFVARANREGAQADTEQEQSEEDQVNARFDDLVARLDRVEGMLSRLTGS
jgi:voltage-gated potassium channel